MNSAIYEGLVRHRRHTPVRNAFRYRVFMMGLDLAELDTVFCKRWLWSTERTAPARFRRADHLGSADQPLDEAVRELVETHTGSRPPGPIVLLTHLRYWGYGFNPVSFYFCYGSDGERLHSVVAEVNNTPWGEQHPYVLKCDGSGRAQNFRFEKAFHVSPFMPMAIEYRWRFHVRGTRLAVHMQNFQSAEKCFDATMTLERREIETRSLASVLVRYPLMTLRVVAAIHFQALVLWLKGCPVFTHPAKLLGSSST